jgi:release factor glutamine methyltransferase
MAADTTSEVERRLRVAGCVNAAGEAAALLTMTTDALELDAMVRRREQGEPLEWITRTVTFCGLRLHIEPGVYVPRPQTEELARRAAAALPSRGAAVDLCTGCGAVAAHLRHERPDAAVVGVDIAVAAVRTARRNGVEALLGDLDQPLTSHRFDVVTAVAPYVPTEAIRLLPADVQRWEPRRALDGGHDGLASVRRVIAGAARLLRPGGALFLEVGGDHHLRLGPDWSATGFADVDSWFDDDGDLRGVSAIRRG